jgi:anaplastic lymphoma kinase
MCYIKSHPIQVNMIQIQVDVVMQDPSVVNTPLPMFYRPPSSEREATVMRPPEHEISCLHVQRPADYLVLLPGPSDSELPSSPSTSSVHKLLAANSTSNLETSFVLPESKSTQLLLEEAASSSSSITTSSTSNSDSTGKQKAGGTW